MKEKIEALFDSAGFSSRLAALREKNNESQQDLANALNEDVPISRALIGMWEEGKRIPKIDHIIALSEHYGVDCNYLITGTAAEDKAAAEETGFNSDVIRAAARVNAEKKYRDFMNPYLEYFLSVMDVSEIADYLYLAAQASAAKLEGDNLNILCSDTLIGNAKDGYRIAASEAACYYSEKARRLLIELSEGALNSAAVYIAKKSAFTESSAKENDNG